jgi:zinc transporter, ZIP family
VREAFFWGLLAGSSLLVGAVLALTVPIRERLHGWIMAFGAGVLISAVAFELVEDAFETSAWSGSLALGLFAGCAAFTLGDALIDRMGGSERKVMGRKEAEGSPLAIVLGIVLDGIPESMVIGLTLLEGGEVSAAVIVAVFLSNLPEAVAATSGLREQGRSPSRILALWVGIVLVSALASLAGYGLFDDASPDAVAFVLAFAGGAILTMLADTMMPEAFRHGGKLVGFFTTVGFGVAFAVSMLE